MTSQAFKKVKYSCAPAQNRSLQAVANIKEAAAELVKVPNMSRISARALAEKSGYSIGNIYHHFESVANVLIEIYDDKRIESQKKIADLFRSHSPDEPCDSLAVSVTDQVLSHLNDFNPKILAFCLTAKSKNLNNPFEIDKSVEGLVEIFNETIARDRTNTFRKMARAESHLLAKIYVYALRQPYIDESELMGTEQHRDLIIKLFFDLFSTKPLKDSAKSPLSDAI